MTDTWVLRATVPSDLHCHPVLVAVYEIQGENVESSPGRLNAISAFA
jgi:hypothetical protein